VAENTDCPWRGLGESAVVEAECLRKAQPAAVEKREHRRVAGVNPLRALVARSEVGVGHLLRRADRQRPRQGFGDFRRAYRAERADLAVASAFEEARKPTYAGERAHQRTAADAFIAARRHIGAHIGRRERGKVLERRRAAKVPSKEAEELQHVALVGLDGFRRHAALVAEKAQPALDLGYHFRRYERKRAITCL